MPSHTLTAYAAIMPNSRGVKKMSAFLVSHDHIDALLSFALRRYGYGAVRYHDSDNNHHYINSDTATETGRILLRENLRSLKALYHDSSFDSFLADKYNFRQWNAPLTTIAILKGCSCFDYQACETDDYRESTAFRIIQAIRHRAIHHLPGYDDAPGWEFRRHTSERGE